jgi:hemerythrin-like domain-containing protein
MELDIKADGPSLRRSALDYIEHVHHMQLLLCDALENIADGLPSGVDHRLCRQVLDMLRDDVPLHHRDEERGLFPLIERRATPGDNIHAILVRLAFEHATDESYAGELIECLETLCAGQPLSNPGMAGYMLRGFFESYRRHIYWENAVVLPLARARLTNADLDELGRAMTSHRGHGTC